MIGIGYQKTKTWRSIGILGTEIITRGMLYSRTANLKTPSCKYDPILSGAFSRALRPTAGNPAGDPTVMRIDAL